VKTLDQALRDLDRDWEELKRVVFEAIFGRRKK